MEIQHERRKQKSETDSKATSLNLTALLICIIPPHFQHSEKFPLHIVYKKSGTAHICQTREVSFVGTKLQVLELCAMLKSVHLFSFYLQKPLASGHSLVLIFHK